MLLLDDCILPCVPMVRGAQPRAASTLMCAPPAGVPAAAPPVSRSCLLGSTYMWDMAPPNQTDKKAPRHLANDTLSHLALLRHPLLRLRAQVPKARLLLACPSAASSPPT